MSNKKQPPAPTPQPKATASVPPAAQPPAPAAPPAPDTAPPIVDQVDTAPPAEHGDDDMQAGQGDAPAAPTAPPQPPAPDAPVAPPKPAAPPAPAPAVKASGDKLTLKNVTPYLYKMGEYTLKAGETKSFDLALLDSKTRAKLEHGVKVGSFVKV